MGDQDLAALGTVWHEDLEELTDAALRDAAKDARRRCQYMPKPADVLAAYRELSERPQHRLPSATDARALPQGNVEGAHWTEEQAARNRAGAQAVLEKLASRMRA